MLLTREMTTLSYPRMGWEFNRDHSTVIHGVRSAKALRERDESYARKLADSRRMALLNETAGWRSGSALGS